MKKIQLLLVLTSLSFTPLSTNAQSFSEAIINSGSVLCKDLKVKYILPDSLKTGYTVSVSFDAKKNTQELFITYAFVPKEGAILNTEIISELTPLFWPLGPGFSEDQSKWTQHLSIEVDKKATTANIVFSPYQKCFEVSKKCGEVVYKEKQMRYSNDCGSPLDFVLSARINDDSLIVESKNIPVLTVCILEHFGIDSSTATFSDLTDKNYSIHKIKRSLEDSFISKEYLAQADLSKCIMNSNQETHSVNIKIYPNPVKESLFIEGFKGTVNITNSLGKVFKIEGNELFDLSSLSLGVYVLNFEMNDGIHQEKIVIE